MKISDYRGNQIELTKERWQHIITEHPEVRGLKDRLLQILSAPDLVKCSKRDRDVLLYYRYTYKYVQYKRRLPRQSGTCPRFKKEPVSVSLI